MGYEYTLQIRAAASAAALLEGWTRPDNAGGAGQDDI